MLQQNVLRECHKRTRICNTPACQARMITRCLMKQTHVTLCCLKCTCTTQYDLCACCLTCHCGTRLLRGDV